jgi:hypothetical protein
MRRIKENADYDISRDRGSKNYSINAHDFVSRPDMKVRNVGNYGDNAMSDVSRIDYDDTNATRVYEDDDDSMLDRLKEILTRANVSDTHMEKGVKLTPTGCQKVAARLGIAASEVATLLKSLSSKLRREARTTTTAIVNEGRYTYERDAHANVTIRDSESGNEMFVRGSEAMDVIRRIENGEDEQTVLASHMGLMEDDTHPDASYADEMTQKWGTFNFPWSLDDGRHGTGTVRYDADGTITLKHIRDERGREINPPATDRAEIMVKARDFIGRE